MANDLENLEKHGKMPRVKAQTYQFVDNESCQDLHAMALVSRSQPYKYHVCLF